MRTPTYVETGVALGYDSGAAAWTFDLAHWGVCGQGPDEAAALGDLARAIGRAVDDLTVVERVEGDEQAFKADLRPAATAERRRTQDILANARAATLALYRSLPADLLDVDDPDREMPSWARWRTLREMFWHVCDTDCRYYLPRLGQPGRERAGDLDTELVECAAHVRHTLGAMPLNAVRRDDDEVWTSRKVLRRLAWHERSELAAMRELVLTVAPLRGLPPPPLPH